MDNSLGNDSHIKINEEYSSPTEKNRNNRSNCSKLLVVLWKSWLFRKHHYLLFTMEILTCIIISLLLTLLFRTALGKLTLKPNFNQGHKQNHSHSRNFEDADPPKSKETIVDEMVSAVFFPTVWIDEDKLPKSIQTLRKLERLEENKPQISRVAVIRENKFILAFSPKNVQFANDFMNYYFMPLLKAAIYRHWTITDPDEELGPGALQMLVRGYQNEGEIETAFKKWVVASHTSHKNGSRRLGRFIGGIVLPSSKDKKNPTKLTYKLRLSDRIFKTWANPFLFYPLGSHDSVPWSPHNNSEDSGSWIPSPFEKSPYATNEFLGLQLLIEDAFIKMIFGKPFDGNPATDIVQTFGEIPSLTRKNNQDDFILSFAFPIAIALSFIFSYILMVQGMTSEKETGFKSLLKIHGLGFKMNFVGWTIITIFVLIFVSIILSITFSIAFLKHTNGFLLWVIIFCYGAHTFTLAFLISSIFAKAMPACLFAIALYLASFLGALSILGGGISSNSPYLDISLAPKLFLCIFPNFSLYFATNIILGFEGREKSAGWSSLYQPFANWDHLTIGYILTVELIVSAIFIILGFYLENVLPSNFRVKKSWYYPFQKKTWFGGKVGSISKVEPRGPHQLIQNNGVNFEPDPVALTPIVSLYKLTKVYNKKTVVDGISLHFYATQITALLGHNGTGKSTMMAMLTGLTSPSKGTAIINGSDITKDLNGAQRCMSFCPQENLQSNSLNVLEHLKLFALLKGCSFKQADEEAGDWIKKLKLEDKKTSSAQKLSGGQKRKLQLGMALIRSDNHGNENVAGGGHVVFLDEPSSGLDPQARIDIREIFIGCRGSISIIFSTHFTDEADMLADRVVIMRAGKLECIGSPFFLKDIFGNGYTLHLTLQNHYLDSKNASHMTISDSEELLDSNSFITPCPRFCTKKSQVLDIEKQNEQDQQTLSLVQSHFPKAITLPTKSTGSKATKISTRQLNINIFEQSLSSSSSSSNVLPSSQTQSSLQNNEASSVSVSESKSEPKSKSKMYKSSPTSKFPALFSDIEKHAQEIGIFHISLSFTTMDDVFAKMGAQEYSHNENTVHENLFMHGNPNGDRNLARVQFKALLLKKLLVTWRKRPLLLFQILAPIIITIAAILSLSLNYAEDSVQPPPRTITLSAYSNPITLFSSSSLNMTAAFKSAVGISAKELKKSGGGKSDVKKEIKKIGSRSPGEVASRYILAAELNETNMLLLYSSKAPHSAPLAINIATNTIIQKLAKESNQMGNAIQIQVVNSPLISNKKLDRDLERLEKVRYEKELSEQYLYRAFSMFFHPFGFILMFGLVGGFAVSFVYVPAQEKISQWKHLQMMTRVSPISYWLAIFIVDFLIALTVFLVMISLIPIFFYGFGQFTPLMGQNGLGVFFLILLTFFYVNIIIAYIASALAKTVTGTMIFLAIFQCIIVPVLYLLVVSLTLLGLQQSNKLEVPSNYTGSIDAVIIFFSLFPSFNTLLSFTRYSDVAERSIACSQIPKEILDFACIPKTKNDSLFNTSAAICCRNCLKDFPHLPCFKVQSYLHDLNQDGIGNLLLLQWIIGTILLVILGLIEYKVVEKCSCLQKRRKTKMNDSENAEIKTEAEEEAKDPNQVDDEDVASEIFRVSKEVNQKRFDDGDCFLANRLSKSFQKGRIKAVSNISFAVRKDQCFGLLGQNGCGKTTTFRMLVGQEIPDSGNAYINAGSGDLNCNLDTNKREFLNHIGYCPQFDAFSGFLTGKELLLFMGRLRGIDSKHVKDVAEQWLQQMGLEKSANVQSKKYSGGMKRKLSSALALIGSPKIILLDEPSTGVDPEARLKFWSVLSKAQAAGQAIILTSHSMEECEYLCSNLCIMVNGKMRCIGGVEDLKNRFAPGRDLTIKLTSRIPSDLEILPLKQQIEEKLDPCVLKDQHGSILQYQIQNKDVLWSTLFQIMEEIKIQYQDIIQEYTIQETTLEQVFLTIVKSQKERELRKPKQCCTFCSSRE